MKQAYHFAPYLYRPTLGVVVPDFILKKNHTYILLERMLAVLKVPLSDISKLVISELALLSELMGRWQPRHLLLVGYQDIMVPSAIDNACHIACAQTLYDHPQQKREAFLALCQLKERLKSTSG